MQRTPSRPVIGARYAVGWYALRTDDRAYRALNAPMDADEHAVQRALLLPRRSRQPAIPRFIDWLTNLFRRN